MIQPGTLIRVILHGQDLYLTKDHTIRIEDTSLRNHISSFKGHSYWLVRVLNHNPEQGNLFVDVVNYSKQDVDFLPGQSALNPELSCIKKLNIKDLPTPIFLKTCHRHEYPQSIEFVTNMVEEAPPKKQKVESYSFKKTIKETISVSVNKVQIGDGFVFVNYMFDNHFQSVDLKITNSFLKKEFDAIKNYFWNCLEVKKLEVSAEVELTNGVVTSLVAQSKEVDRINQELIQNVQYKIIRDAYRKRESSESEGIMITKEQFFSKVNVRNEILNELINEKVLLNGLIVASKTKHYRNVQHLAEIHLSRLVKLHLVMEPFSFIFLVEGTNNYHIVWETLNGTDATYIWYFPKDMARIKLYYKELDRILRRISEIKRNEYLKEPDPNFQRINHDYSDEELGYRKWMNMLTQVISE